jgi:hypothetical protein
MNGRLPRLQLPMKLWTKIFYELAKHAVVV